MGGTAGTVEVPPSRLNPTDAALWDIERNPDLRTTIVAAMTLDRPVDEDRLVDELEVASRRIPRLRQRVVGPVAGLGTPHWEIAPDFDVSDHVRVLEVPSVDDGVIADAVAPLASTPFDRDRPLWEAVYLAPRAGRSAILLKVHHSLTDGVGGVGLLDVILDRRRNGPRARPDSVPVPVAGRRRRDELDGTIRRAVAAPFDVAGAATTAAFHPVRSATGLWQATRSAGRLLAPSSAPLSPLMTGRSGQRAAGVCEIELRRLHDAAARHGCTVNHAFFAGVVAGIAAYHRSRNSPLAQLRVTMPISFRRRDDGAAGNQWAPVRFVVPADIDDPVERMLAMRELVVTVRREPALSFSHSLAGLVQMLPPALSSGVVGGMMHGVDVTLTNVPGLTTPHYLGGAMVERFHAFPPTAGSALNVGLVSHLDLACVGMLTDAAAVDVPSSLHELIAAGLEDLVAAAETAAPQPAPEPAPPADDGPDRLTALDAAFLHMETPEMPVHIGGVFVVDGEPLRDADGRLRLDDARRHVDARLRRLPRFRRRLARVPFGIARPVWVDDPDFDIARHVRSTTISGGRDELLALCADLYATPLDREHPLWDLTLVDGLDDGSVGIVERVHHALIDGVSGVELAAAVFDLEPVHTPDRPSRRARPATAPNATRLVFDAVTEQAGAPVDVARRVAASLRSPRRLAGDLAAVGSSARDVLRATTAKAPFNVPVGASRELRTVVTELPSVRTAGHDRSATVNDIVLAAVAGGLRRWFDTEQIEPFDLHVLVPVSTRTSSLGDGPGNQVGAVLVELPVGEPDSARRVELVHERMARLKAAHDGEGAALLLGAFDHVPAPLSSAVTRLVAVQPFVNAVVTNVPGPDRPLYFLGGRIEEIVPVVPLGPRLGLGIAVLSYCDRLTVSLLADPDSVADLDVLEAALAHEFSLLGARSA